MTEDDFQLDCFKSFASFVPATFKRQSKAGQDKFYHAAEISFSCNHEDFGKDLFAAKIIKSRNGAPFYAVKASEFDPVDKKVYLSGLPSKVEWSEVVRELANFVEFFDEGSPAYHLENERYTGRRLVQVKKFKSVPPTRLYLAGGGHDGLGFSVFAVGHGQRQPVPKVQRKCFCCHKTDHEVKDCPKKKEMKFSWKCSVCGLKSVKCTVGHCFFDSVTDEANKMFELSDGIIPDTETAPEYSQTVASWMMRLSDGGKMVVTKFDKLDDDYAKQWSLLWNRLRLNWYMNRNWRVFDEAFNEGWFRSEED